MGLVGPETPLWRRLATLAACFSVCLALGSCFSIGNLTTYVTSYLRARHGDRVQYADTIWLDTVLRVTMGPAYALGGLLWPRLGARATAVLGGGLLLLGSALCSLAVRHSLAALVCCYSLLQGAGIAVALAATSLTCVAWMPRRCGLALGVNMAGFALGPVLFNWLQTGYVNAAGAAPGGDGYFGEPELLRRVPSVFLVQACAQAVLLLPAVTLQPAPDDQEQAASTTADVEKPECKANIITEENSSQQLRTFGVREALRTREFYQLLVGYVPTVVAFEFYQVSWKTFGLTLLRDDRQLTLLGSVSPLWALAGNLFWGWLGDTTTFGAALTTAHALLAALLFSMPAAGQLGAAGYSCWLWALAGGFWALFACQLPLLRSYFGTRNAGLLLGLMNMARALVTPATPLLAQRLLRDQRGYPTLFLVQGGLAAVAMVSMMLTRDPERSTQRQMATSQALQPVH